MAKLLKKLDDEFKVRNLNISEYQKIDEKNDSKKLPLIIGKIKLK